MRRGARAAWSGHSCPSPLILVVYLSGSSRMRVPHFSRPFREVGLGGQARPLSFRPESERRRRRSGGTRCFLPIYRQRVFFVPACSPILSRSPLCALVSFATPLEVHHPRQEHFPSRVRECAGFPSDPHGCFFPGNTPLSARQRPSQPRPH